MKKAVSCFIFLLLLLSTGAAAVSAAERIKGSDRYATAVAVSQKGWATARTVVLAKGTDFPDALAGGPLAYLYDAPILLTKENELTAVTAAEIKRLKAEKVVILGSAGAVSETVRNQLKEMDLEVERIGGADRYETAAMIAEKLGSSEAFVAYGGNFPDSLSAAPYAARNGIPILLTRTDRIPASTAEALKGKNKTLVLGSAGVVSDTVMRQLPNPTRFGGKDRYETTKKVVTELPLGTANAFVVTGQSFADALTGSVLAAKKDAPLILVRQSSIPSDIKSLFPVYEQIDILGGTGAVGEAVKKELEGKHTEFVPQGISIGDPVAYVVAQLGKPDRVDQGGFDGQWYIYNKDYSQYLQVGIKDGKVIALYSNADIWESLSGIRIGTAEETVDQKLKTNIHNWTDGKHFLIENKYYAIIRIDHIHDKTVSSIELIEKDFYIDGYFSSFNFLVGTGNIQAIYEKQIFDLANAERVRFGLSPYLWDEKVAGTARRHSEDMSARNYYSHYSPEGKSPFDRMEEDGIIFGAAAENIAAGQGDPATAHQDWMQSEGHRGAILGEYERLGVGAATGGHWGSYYTQNFYSMPWY